MPTNAYTVARRARAQRIGSCAPLGGNPLLYSSTMQSILAWISSSAHSRSNNCSSSRHRMRLNIPMTSPSLGEVLNLLGIWRGASFADVNQQTGFGEPGRGEHPMARIPASQRTREELTALIEGRLSTTSAKDELVKLATRLIVEEALEGEAGDAVGRDYYEHGAEPGQGYRNGYRTGRLKTAEGAMEYAVPQVAGRDEPFRSAIREHLKGHTRGLDDLAIEMLARGLSVRDIEDAFKEETGG